MLNIPIYSTSFITYSSLYNSRLKTNNYSFTCIFAYLIPPISPYNYVKQCTSQLYVTVFKILITYTPMMNFSYE